MHIRRPLMAFLNLAIFSSLLLEAGVWTKSEHFLLVAPRISVSHFALQIAQRLSAAAKRPTSILEALRQKRPAFVQTSAGAQSKKTSRATLSDGMASSIGTLSDVVEKSVDCENEEGRGGKKIAFTPDGSKMLVSTGSEVKIEDFSQPTVLVTIVGGFSNAGGLAVTPDSSRALVVDTSANVVVILNIRSSPVAVEGWVTPGDPAVPLSPTCVVVTPDGTTALVGNNNSAADQYRVAILKIGQKVTYDYAVSIPDETGSVGFMNIAITPDGERALVAQNSNKVYVIDLIHGPKAALIQDVAVGGCVSSIAITPNGKMALVANYLDNTIHVFDPSQPYICPGYTVSTSGPCYDVAISPDGKRAFAVNWDYGSEISSTDVFDLTQTPHIVLIDTKKTV